MFHDIISLAMSVSVFYKIKKLYIEYIMDMVNKQKQDVVDAKIIAPIHKKGLITLEKLMCDLDMHGSFQRIAYKYKEIHINNVLRILIRLKMYFKARNEIIKMIEEIEKREGTLDNIRNVVLGMTNDHEMDKRKQEIGRDLHLTFYEYRKLINLSAKDHKADFRLNRKLFDQLQAIWKMICL